VQQLVTVGAGPEHVPGWPRNVPEVHQQNSLAQFVPDVRRCEAEVIILQPDDRPLGRFLAHSRCELLVRLPVALPVGLLRADRRQRGVTQRPEDPVAEATVVVVHLLLGEPHASERVRGVVRWHRDAVVLVDGRLVRLTVAPGNPGPARPLHHRVETCCQPPSRAVYRDIAVVSPLVTVRLAVRHDEQLVRFERPIPFRTAEVVDLKVSLFWYVIHYDGSLATDGYCSVAPSVHSTCGLQMPGRHQDWYTLTGGSRGRSEAIFERPGRFAKCRLD
jgi:hypothetical protein